MYVYSSLQTVSSLPPVNMYVVCVCVFVRVCMCACMYVGVYNGRGVGVESGGGGGGQCLMTDLCTLILCVLMLVV